MVTLFHSHGWSYSSAGLSSSWGSLLSRSRRLTVLSESESTLWPSGSYGVSYNWMPLCCDRTLSCLWNSAGKKEGRRQVVDVQSPTRNRSEVRATSQGGGASREDPFLFLAALHWVLSQLTVTVNLTD